MDLENEIDVKFVGRNRDLEKLQLAWRQYRILGVYGLRAIGKSRLVREFFHRQQEIVPSHLGCVYSLEKLETENGKELAHCALHTDAKLGTLLMTVDLRVPCGKYPQDWVYNKICECLGIPSMSGDMEKPIWATLIIQKLTDSEDGRPTIICFENAEDVIECPQSDDFLRLCIDLATLLQNIHIVIISTTQPQVEDKQGLYTFHVVEPLTKADSSALFHNLAPDVKLGPYEGAILELTEGLPLLILMVASELAADGGMFTVEEMVQLLTEFRLRTLSREYYPSDDRVSDVYKKFIQRLPSHLTESLATLEFIPGSFDLSEAHEILALPESIMADQYAILPAVRRHMVTKHQDVHRFNIQGVLREVLRIYFAVRNLPEIRLRYCRVFTSVITKLARRSTSAAFMEAAETFKHEEVNLHKLLKEVNNADHEQNTYHFFLQVATECTVMLERFFPGKCDTFLRGCERLSERYGSDTDRARMRIAVGSYLTNIKDDYMNGIEEYRKAHAFLTGNKTHNTSKLNTTGLVLQRTGWNLHMQGKDTEAVRYLEGAMRESLKFNPKDDKVIRIQALNSLGLVNTNLGNYNAAHGYLDSVLKFSKIYLGENHPSVGVTLTYIGHVYENQRDYESAIKYCKLGHEIILKFAEKTGKPFTILLEAYVDLAKVSCSLHDFTNAHRYLHECSRLLKSQDESSLHVESKMYLVWGNVMREEGKLDDAVDMFQKSLEILERLDKSGVKRTLCLMNISKVKILQGRYASALKIAQKALLLRSSVSKNAPFSRVSLETLYLIAEIHLKTNEIVKYNLALEEVKLELHKLRDFYEGEKDEEKIRGIDEELVKLREKSQMN